MVLIFFSLYMSGCYVNTLHFFGSFCRTDLKFCSCSDDTSVKVWDFARCQEERSLSGKVACFFFVYVTVSCTSS
jgi:hypothetical protein